jgi:glycosyltransferase involved in cell wall biosynthesis
MRILWLGHNLAYPPKGGALQRNYNLLRQAAKKFEVHTLVFDQPATRPSNITPEDCVQALSAFCASVNWLSFPHEGMRGYRYWLAMRGLISREPFEVNWLRSRAMAQKLQKVLKKSIVDVIHFDTLGLAQYRSLVKGAGTILNHHDVQSAMMIRRAKNEGNFLLSRYWYREADNLRRSEQKWCPQFNENLVCSEDEGRLLAGLDSEIRTRIVANGVDTEYFTPRPDPGGATLLFCGSLDMYSNRHAMRYFFDAIWPRLIRLQNKLEVYIVGKMPPEWLKQISVKDRRVHVTGFVEDVRPYFRKATVSMCPIRDGGGTRLKILDSLAMGVPVISTSFACSGLCLTHGENILVADTPEEFAGYVEKVFSEEPLRTKLSTSGIDVVNRVYSWEVIGKSLRDTYEEVSIGNREYISRKT